MNNFVVSARKYRPVIFKDVVGQSAITNTLSKAIRDNHLAQSFLFCGPRGVGKTTCARILAKTINCLNLSVGIDACDLCESCTAFNDNHSFNIHELDAASNNSVDGIRSLIDQVRFAPQVGAYNIYIIDEVHMLSTNAFNAFLKTLEEPPRHAIFILATTEKHKIIPTILSRCQIFDFKSISVNDIVSHLQYVSMSERINSEKDALHIIAQKAGGSLRDSLSMFDRLVNSSDLTLSYKSVIDNLNILDHDYYLKITKQIINNDVSSIMLTINEILSNGFDGHQFVMGLASHFRDLLVSKDKSTIVLLDKGKELEEKYLTQSQEVDLEFLIKALRICSKCDVEYRASKNQRLLVELTLLKMVNIGDIFSEKKKIKNKLIIPSQNNNLDKDNVNKEADVKSHNEGVIFEEVVNFKEKINEEENVNLEPPKRKLRKSSFSLSDVLKDNDNKELEIKPKIKEKYTELNMQQAWSAFSIKTQNEGKTNLYITLSSSVPILLTNNIILIKISNEAQQKILDENKIELLSYLRSKLKNDFIEINTEMSIESKIDIPYTNKDKFMKMIEENPSIKILQNKLGLDPDH